MKLDKMKFARIIAHCVSNGMSAGEYEVNTLDELIDIDVSVQQSAKANPVEVDNLLALMAEGTRKIEAISVYRNLTGAGLKESKDAVEKYYRLNKGSIKEDIKNEMINKINDQINGYDVDNEYVLEQFSNNQLVIIRNFIKNFY